MGLKQNRGWESPSEYYVRGEERKKGDRRKSRSAQRLERRYDSRDPAQKAICEGVMQLMTKVWQSGEETIRLIGVPGGHAINQLKVKARKENGQIFARVEEVKLCEKFAHLPAGNADAVFLAVKAIGIQHTLPVKESKVKASLRHNAEAFAHAIMRKVHRTEHHKTRGSKRERVVRKFAHGSNHTSHSYTTEGSQFADKNRDNVGQKVQTSTNPATSNNNGDSRTASHPGKPPKQQLVAVS